jgi:hypothetical protein
MNRGIFASWGASWWPVRAITRVMTLVALGALWAAQPAAAQGSRKDDVIINAQGRPLAGATVRVCTAASTGEPCAPLANIYSNQTLTQAMANPLTTDGLGNYFFYAAPGRYTIEVSGPGLITKQFQDVILPNDPSDPTFTSLSTSSGISAFSLTLSGNLTVTGSAAVGGTLTMNGKPVAVSPPQTDGIQYVSPGGDDANDGLSWGTSKHTAYAAVTALPGGDPANFLAGAGTVFLSEGTATALSMGGPKLSLSILGPNDPHWNNTISSASRSGDVVTLNFPGSHNYSTGQAITVYGVAGGTLSFDGDFTVLSTPTSTSLTFDQTGPDESAIPSTGQVLPTGWLRETGGVSLIGYGQTSASNNPGGPTVRIDGSGNSTSYAALALAGVGSRFRFEGISFGGAYPFRIGLDSNGSGAGNAGAASVQFHNCSFDVAFPDLLGSVPAVQIGPNVLWLFMDHIEINTLGQSILPISSISRSGNVVTVSMTQTMSAPFWKAGQEVLIQGVSDTSFNGTFTITSVANGATFSWTQTGSDASSSGGNVRLTPNNDNRAAVLVDTTGGTNSALIHIHDAVFNGGGGVRWKNGPGVSSNINLEHITMEGAGNSQPVYEALGTPVPQALLRDLAIADSGDTPPLVRVPAGNLAEWTRVEIGTGQEAISVDGPAVILGGRFLPNSAVSTAPNVSPAGKGQIGLFSSRFYGEVDDVRRNFSPSLVQFANLAATSCSSWTNQTGADLTVTCNQPDATRNGTAAGNLNRTTSGDGYATAYSGSRTIKAGDYFLIGAWVRANTTAGVYSNLFAPANGPLFLSFGGNARSEGVGQNLGSSTSAYIAWNPVTQEDGQWQWVWAWDRVRNTNTTVAQTVQLRLQVTNGYPLDFYAPVLMHIPISALSRGMANVSSVSRSDNITTVTTTATQSIQANQIVCISDVTDTTFNGCFKILSVPSGTTFTVKNTGSNASSSSGVVYASADSEAGELALSLAAHPSSCSAGQLCTMFGPVVGGSFSTKSSGYTLTATDSWVNVTGTTTITVPHSIVGSRWVVFNSGSNTVTLQPDGGNINGAANLTLSANTGREITCDGNNCYAH